MNRFRHLLFLTKNFGKQGISLRNRLLLYLLFMSFAVIIVTMTVLVAMGIIFNGTNEVNERLAIQLEHSGSSLQENVNLLSGYGNSLADNLSREIEYYLGSNTEISSLSDQPERLLELQRILYGEISTTLKLARCSGSFATLDATTNTQVEGNYRSGVFLRLSNVNSNVQLDPDVYLFRGIPEIAMEKGLELHNRWNLEFNLDEMPFCSDMLGEKRNGRGRWLEKQQLKNTWENVLMYCCPIVGKQGQVYGVCGVDMSELYMQLSYPAAESEFGPLITVIAPLRDGALVTQEGLIGTQGGIWMTHFPTLSVREKNGITYYHDGAESYVGRHSLLNMPGDSERQWVCAVLIPTETYREYADAARSRMILFGIVFAAILLILSIIVSKSYVDPIVSSLDSLQSAQDLSGVNTGISELDTLLRYFDALAKSGEETMKEEALPPNIEELFVRFEEGVHKLSNAEYNVFLLYMEGYTVAEIPEKAFISMSTVKKHNRSIYEKLNISSYDELMLYVDLFRRCDRLDALKREIKT